MIVSLTVLVHHVRCHKRLRCCRSPQQLAQAISKSCQQSAPVVSAGMFKMCSTVRQALRAAHAFAHTKLSLATFQNLALPCHLMRRQVSQTNEKVPIWTRINVGTLWCQHQLQAHTCSTTTC